MRGRRRVLRFAIAACASLLMACGDDSNNNTDAPPLSAPTGTVTLAPPATPTAAPTTTATSPPTPTPTALTPIACAALAGMQIGGAHIDSAEAVAAAGTIAEYCKVLGTIGTALKYEMRLPRTWNRKALFIGGNGFDGLILPPDVLRPGPSVLTVGYATIATDSGHQGSPFEATWALDNPAAVDDFAYLARTRVLAAARQILLAHYAEPVRRTYFEGGSSGGREALIEAQRWPENFDGVIARAPALSFITLLLNSNRVVKQAFSRPEAWLSPVQIDILSRAVLAECDAHDGLAEGIVSNVAACNFDPGNLRCAGDDTTDCLTAAQLETVETIFSPLQLDFPLANGVTGHAAYPITGAESSGGGWPLWITNFRTGDRASLLFTLQDQFIKFFVTEDPDFDSLQFTASAARAELEALSALLDATDPDLFAFRARGGKLILWHGVADYAISAYGTVEYYERLVATAGGQERADEFVRFYTSPAIDHTGTGAGAPLIDLLGALDEWVENGTPPGDLIAYKNDGGTQIPFRPLCRYPAYPHYDGAGDPRAAASFTCTAP